MLGSPARTLRSMSSTDCRRSLVRLIPLLLALSMHALAGTRLVPAFAQHVPGANQSFWQSELRLFNPTTQSATVTIANVLPYNGSTCTGFAPITIHPGELVQVRDAGCGDGGAAAIELSCDDALEITSLIVNVGSAPQTKTCCLVGFTQTIPIVPTTEYRSTQTLANVQVPGVTPIMALGRSNLGFVNPNPTPLTVTLTYFGPQGEEEPVFRYNTLILPPRSLTQVNDALAQPPTNLTDVPVINAYFRIQVSAPGTFYLYDSYVDNATNDATFLEPVKAP